MATSTTPAAQKVLLLGVHMNPGEPFPESALISMIEKDISKGREHGLEISYELTYSEQPDYSAIAKRLKSASWDIVAIGAGVRFPKDRSALFECLVNATVRFAKPSPLLVFNTTPDGVVDACLRNRKVVGEIDELEHGLS